MDCADKAGVKLSDKGMVEVMIIYKLIFHIYAIG
jgi:hypothetical protein